MSRSTAQTEDAEPLAQLRGADLAAPELELRPAARTDAPALARLITQLGYPVEPEVMEARLPALLDGQRGTQVAVLEGRVVGMVGHELVPSYTRDAPGGRLLALVVDGELRGQGIGARLVRHAEDLLRAAGATRVTLASRLERAAAHRFYEGLGYRTNGVRMARPLTGPDAVPDPASPRS